MKVLLAIDGSPRSAAAAAEVARLPWPPRTEVRIVTVDVPVDTRFIQRGSTTIYDEIVKEQRREAEQWLRDAEATVRQNSSGLLVTTTLLEGWPKDMIVAEAERFGADMVVVGSHGYGPIRRFFLGSVSLFVAQHAPCSVLIVRQPPEAAPA